jgi:ribosomal protein L1
MEAKIKPIVEGSKKFTVEEAIKQLRSGEKRKFVQSLDLVVNLQKIDPRKEALNIMVAIPNAPQKRICAFLLKKSKLVDTIVKEEFDSFKDNKQVKKFAKRYDVFIASAPLMGTVATKFGRTLGPLGKMPTPQAGVIMQETDENVKAMIEKMSQSTKVRVKEKSIKLSIGKEDMSEAQLIQNANSVIKTIVETLPYRKDNIRNMQLKFTMSKPIDLEK